MKALKSWRKRVNSLLAIVMVVVILFLAWTNTYYSLQIRQNIIAENSNALKVWESFVKLRLDALYEHVYELLLTVYANTELAHGTPAMDYLTQKKCLDLMSNKLRVNSGADCFFLLDTQDNITLFSANSDMSPSGILTLKEAYKDIALRETTSLHDRLWRIVYVGDQVFLVKSIAIGKYVAGTMSRVQQYDIATNYSIVGELASFQLVEEQGGEVFHCGGDEVWLDCVVFDAQGKPYISGLTTSVSQKLSFTGNGTYVLVAARQNGFWGDHSNAGTTLLVFSLSVACAMLLILLAYNLKKMVVLPTKELLKANQAIISGNMNYRIATCAESEEFDVLFNSFNEMTGQISNLRIESYDRLLKEQENKLLLLRAQLKPHFFLNAITTVSNMTYQNRLEDIRSYLLSLAKFVRYMLGSARNFITVGEEISHIDNYLQMQALRFPGSIEANINCDETIRNVKIPILTLFTLVENTFKHAMSLYETLSLKINCERINTENFRGCRLMVEDSGSGFPEELLSNWCKDTDTVKDHFGLSNVRYTLQLTYNRFDLLRISNAPGGGACVEIWIPSDGGDE